MLSIISACRVLLFVASLTKAIVLRGDHDAHDDHSHIDNRQLATGWHHARDHPVHALFARAPGDGTNYPDVGSSAWSASFPPAFGGAPDPALLPKTWLDTLNAAIAAGKIPNIPQSHNTPQTNPTYPDGINPNGQDVCSATYKCRNPGDVWDAPDGVFAVSFDDGPVQASGKLLDFLAANKQHATHFMIGAAILQDPQMFLRTFNSGDDIAVHTWSHPYMTTLSNEDVLGQLGWTMQLIHDSTGGRVPKYWRPPYGDSDNRVRAIASEVFGLQTVIWNQDTLDWNLAANKTTLEIIHNSMDQWANGSKTPGLIVLEHEVSDQTVQAFMDGYPLMINKGWNAGSLVRMIGDHRSYQNADSSTSDDVKVQSILPHPAPPSTSTSTSTSASATGGSSSGPSKSTSASPIGTSPDSGQPKLTTSSKGHHLTPHISLLSVVIFFALWT